MLEKALRKAIKDENYELASSIRDELNRRKNSEERKKVRLSNNERSTILLCP